MDCFYKLVTTGYWIETINQSSNPSDFTIIQSQATKTLCLISEMFH